MPADPRTRRLSNFPLSLFSCLAAPVIEVSRYHREAPSTRVLFRFVAAQSGMLLNSSFSEIVTRRSRRIRGFPVHVPHHPPTRLQHAAAQFKKKKKKKNWRKTKRARTRCGACNRAGSGPIFHCGGAIGRTLSRDRVRQRETDTGVSASGKKRDREARTATAERGIESGQKPEGKKDSGGQEGEG